MPQEMHSDQVEARFMKFVMPVTESGCWLWMGGLNNNGYGVFNFTEKPVGAHRWSYEHWHGPITKQTVDHKCRVRCCVNPDHLQEATFQENVLRGEGISAKHAVKTHCPQGHPYDAVNTAVRNGSRHCRACSKIASKQRWQRKLAARRAERSM